MRTAVDSLASGAAAENEDWYSVSPQLFVVLDGATARTNTGCAHGVSWYAAHLGTALSESAPNPSTPLTDALAAGIARVAGLHPACDLSHEGTPSAAVAMVRPTGGWADYLVLGDVSVVFDRGGDIVVISDDRVSQTAVAERRAADAYPIGSPEKNDAMVRMKHAELAMRNRDGGYWIAAAEPAAARHARVGRVALSEVGRFAVLTDGATRVVSQFAKLSWCELLDLAETESPAAVLRAVRALESSDPLGLRWPRNKRSDDATMAIAVGVD